MQAIIQKQAMITIDRLADACIPDTNDDVESITDSFGRYHKMLNVFKKAPVVCY